MLPLAIGPPFGITVLDLPGRIPLPSKITIRVLNPIDLRDRLGPDTGPASPASSGERDGDGSIVIDDKVDNPDDLKAEPLEGGPSDPNATS